MVKHRKSHIKNLAFLVLSTFLFFHLIPIVLAQGADIISADRRITWNPGIPGGIPSRTTIFANVKQSPYNAAGNGTTDDTTAIQNAINACPEGQVVYIPAGTYKISGTLRFSKGIVLRGDGPDKTILQQTSSSAANTIFIGQNISTVNPPETLLTGGYAKGSTTLTLDSSSPNQGLFTAGTYIYLGQSNGSNPLITNGSTWYKIMNNYDNDYASMTQIVKIVSRSGNTITISPGLYMDYSSQYHPFVGQVAASMTVNAGVEDMKIMRTVAYNGQGSFIYLARNAYSWIKNVETYKTGGSHIIIAASYGCEVRDSYWHEAWTYASGGGSYGLTISYHSSDLLITNNIGLYMNISGIEFSGAGGGNVISYNFFNASWIDGSNPKWQTADIITHGSFPFMTLIEGNYVGELQIDNIWGSSGYFTFFRNWATSDHDYSIINPNYPYNDTDLCAAIRLDLAYYTNAVGNILGEANYPDAPTSDAYECYPGSNCDQNMNIRHMFAFRTSNSTVYNTTYRHGNYDYATNSTIWDSSNSNHTLPDSLYLTQKPDFFGCRNWPPYGPDLSPMTGSLPARDRFFGVSASCSSDTVPPTASGFSPAQGATGVPVNTGIVLHVKDSGSGVDKSKIVMTVNGSTVTPVITGTSADYTLTYTPSTPFAYSQAVGVSVAASDLSGNAMAKVIYSFTTAAQQDATPPSASGYSPAQGATGVATNSSIALHVTDSGAGVDKSKIVMTVNGSTVTPVISGTSADYTVTYTPSSAFGYSQTVNVTITASDLAGNAMSKVSYSFTTAASTSGSSNLALGITPAVDSSYSGYSASKLTDGITTGTGGTANTWASTESSANAHWVEINFGKNCDVQTVNLYWAWNSARSQWMTPQEVHIQTWNGTAYSDATVLKNPTAGSLTTAAFAKTTTSKIRIYQPVNMGAAVYPSVLWMSEVQAQ